MLKHTFVSPKADGSDATLLRPSDWNSEHSFDGGALGSLIYRDTGASNGASWLADVAVGSVLVSGGVGAAPAWSATPSLTDLTLTGTLKAADGTGALPGLTFSGNTGTGFSRSSSNRLTVSNGGSEAAAFSTSTILLPVGGQLLWTSATAATG